MFKLTKYFRVLSLISLGVVSSLLTSCDKSFIFEYEKDCEITYRVNFKYDMNLKWANAFTNEVQSVRLYVFDANDAYLCKFEESGEELAKDNYSIKLDLEPGDYKLLAWCGIDNPGKNQHFTVPEPVVGWTTIEHMTCMLKRYADEEVNASSSERLEFMFHGRLDVSLPANEYGKEFVYTVPLTKDTNHIRVVLQHLSGEDVDVSNFSFRIEDANGFYAHDNSVLEDERITYRSYSKSQGEATIVRSGSRDAVKSKTAIADLSIARLMADRGSEMILTVTNDKGEDIARIPVIDYALLTKDYYEDAYNHQMTDQEFLDREDEYIMTLFLDENYRWYSAEIFINSWRVVFNEYDVD